MSLLTWIVKQWRSRGLAAVPSAAPRHHHCLTQVVHELLLWLPDGSGPSAIEVSVHLTDTGTNDLNDAIGSDDDNDTDYRCLCY